jgi:hypothetical protein
MAITKDNLQRCKEQTSSLYIHVKPSHIMGAHIHEEGNTLTSVTNFFRKVRNIGIDRIITTYRPNVLARKVSSYEQLQYRALKGQIKLVPFQSADAVLKGMAGSAKMYNRGYEAMVKSGIIPHFYKFTDATFRTCETIKKITTYMNCDGAFICREKDGQTAISHRQKSLGERIRNEELAQNITDTLTGTPYEWMLNLSENSWPSGVEWPLESMPIPEMILRRKPLPQSYLDITANLLL